jgi:hypothetical protein
MAREWSYWTRNKLQILADCLPRFNAASQRSEQRIYLDLIAGPAAVRYALVGLR